MSQQYIPHIPKVDTCADVSAWYHKAWRELDAHPGLATIRLYDVPFLEADFRQTSAQCPYCEHIIHREAMDLLPPSDVAD